MPTISQMKSDSASGGADILITEGQNERTNERPPARVLSGHHVQNEEGPLSVVTRVMFLRKTSKFSFDKLAYTLSAFLAIFSEAINPELPNDNTHGNTTCRDRGGSGWRDSLRRKATICLLFNNPDQSNSRSIHTRVPTCQHVSLCEQGVHRFYLQVCHQLAEWSWVSPCSSLGLSVPSSKRAVAWLYHLHAYLEKLCHCLLNSLKLLRAAAWN